MSQGSKTGRPKRKHMRPLIFERVRSRVTRQVRMSAKTNKDLDLYVTWASAQVGANKEEAVLLTIDQALGRFFQRDKLFHGVLHNKTRTGSRTLAGTASATSQRGEPPGTGLQAANPSRRLVWR